MVNQSAILEYLTIMEKRIEQNIMMIKDNKEHSIIKMK